MTCSNLEQEKIGGGDCQTELSDFSFQTILIVPDKVPQKQALQIPTA